MLPTFELARPTTLSEAMDQVAAGGVPYVGGTELIGAMNLGLLAPDLLVDLKHVPDLNGVSARDNDLVVGASTRHRDIASSPAIHTHAPIFATACSQLGNVRVRAIGSIGGNVCFADPRSDVTTVLFALGARIHLNSAEGSRFVPIEEFVVAAMESACEPDELVVAVHVPLSDRYQVYLRHQPSEYPTVCIALTADRRQPAGPVGIVVGAVGERPQRYTAPSVEAIDLAEILPTLDVVEDLNGSEDYKRHLAGVFITRAAAGMREAIDVA